MLALPPSSIGHAVIRNSLQGPRAAVGVRAWRACVFWGCVCVCAAESGWEREKVRASEMSVRRRSGRAAWTGRTGQHITALNKAQPVPR